MSNQLEAIVPKILARGMLSFREHAFMPRLVNVDFSAEARLTITHLPAGLITSGVLQSTSYQPKAEGFRIDTAGQAEFNDAHIRGRLDSSRIESSLLVAPVTVLPTEDHDGFFTLDTARPIAPRDVAYQGEWVVLGPLVIRADRLSRRYQDADQLVLAANDPHGEAADGAHQGHNIYYSRFWSHRPILHLDLDYAPFSPVAGAVINRGRLAFKIRTASGQVLAESPVVDLSAKASWRLGTGDAEPFGFLSGGFGAGSLFHIRREMTGSGTTLTTSRLAVSVDMVVDHRHTPPQPEGDGLYIETLLDFSATALSTAAQQALKRRLTLDATTFD